MIVFLRKKSAATVAAEEATQTSGSKWPLLLSIAIVVAGAFYMLTSDVSSQGDWNERYGKRRRT